MGKLARNVRLLGTAGGWLWLLTWLDLADFGLTLA
jgi:hypothetical protein